ncbi:hypothetical protein GGR52DRAFT_574035 [Hypoxylon sp. FL1284]|nr:hypothetical protein GGR52DRAFT_574035 [Hypoxylon sp. FL1284]
MHTSNLLVLALALCNAAVAAPAPTRTLVPVPSPAVELAAAMSSHTPNCAAIENYCKCQNEDFQCETDVDCEWCRDHHAWDNHPPPPKE